MELRENTDSTRSDSHDRTNEYIQLRKSAKGSLTRIKNFVNNFNVNTDQIEQLTARYAQLDIIWHKYDHSQTELEKLNEKEYASNREAFENSFLDVKATIDFLRNKNKLSELHTTPNHTDSNKSVQVKLPDIKLPTFSGAYEEWYSFIEIFDSMIHENSQIPVIQKFYYLKMSLSGEAAAHVQALKPTIENYEHARKILAETYDKKQYIVDAHLTSILYTPGNSKQNLKSLLSSTKQHINALQSLNLENIELWEQTIIFVMKQKFDFNIKRQWELETAKKSNLPTLDGFFTFLEQRCYANESININIMATNKRTQKTHTHVTTNTHTSNKVAISRQLYCGICKQKHRIFECPQFISQNIDERITTLKTLKLCFNCLRKGHFSSECQSQHCKLCEKRHNSLIHRPTEVSTETAFTQEHLESNIHGTTHLSHNSVQSLNTSQILLGTAVILVKDTNDQWHKCRALLDSGSQSNFIKESFLAKLKCETQQTQLSIFGVNQIQTDANLRATISIKSRFNNNVCTLKFISLPNITSKLPSQPLNIRNWNLPNVELADPAFNVSSEIDMLIGAEIYFEILRLDQIKLGNQLPVLQDTEFGWIVAGKTCIENHEHTFSYHTSTAQLDIQLMNFWKLEEVSEKTKFTMNERLVEEHFISTHKRDMNGRFIVTLPKKVNPESLGDSRITAIKRFISLENRLKANVNLRKQYVQFMKEYQELGHMEKITESELKKGPIYFLPHHAVVKEASVTTKVRVVFDASAKTTTGLSLNDILMIGPTIQDDIAELLIRFRKHKYVLTADIVKMYRQVLVSQEDTNLQLIFWRENPQNILDIFRLKTVTYGTASAPFLAIRSLQELANDTANDGIRRVILEDFYVDDLITGGDSLDTLQVIRDKLIQLLSEGGFKLNKFASNHPSLLENISDKNDASVIIFDKTWTIKTLGLLWNSFQDAFYFQVPEINGIITKRTILSTTAKMFDPIGLISPIIITAKILMQRLWELHISWDDEVPQEIKSEWENFCLQLNALQRIRIPRYIFVDNPLRVEIHGFADASERAYGSCIYMRSINAENQVLTRLIAAKSRVAPLKKTTIPRLELCAALLLARLYNKIVRSFKNFTPNSTYLWSDSTITLCWLKKSSRSFKTFVSVRVAEIQELTVGCKWNHINSSQNPADLVSRGVNPLDLSKNELWWKGPSWLSSLTDAWPTQPKANVIEGVVNSELKSEVCFSTTITQPLNILTKYGNFNRLQRVIAYCKRFYHNLKFPHKKHTRHITSEELTKAEETIIGLVQRETFSNEIQQLEKKQMVNRKSKLRTLNPFLDERGLLRVGGRLERSVLKYEQKFPLILPYDHHLTEIIVRNEHERLFHCGHEQVLATLRRKYWILSGRRLVKKIIHKCIKCFKVNPTVSTQIMGNLPIHRVNAYERPFMNCGIDYAGPISLRESRRRGKIAITKVYIAIFVCFAVKSVHIEIVSDLTTDCFIAALKRFIGRRGLCKNIYSDNGTTFVGANTKLKEIFNFLKSNETSISSYLSKERINWHFIPPKSPHFGGLWESLIKSMKRHLYRTMQKTVLTYEELNTLLIGIESCLNSRPLTPYSSDPKDLNVLTPAHFLIGSTLTEPTELDLSTSTKTLKSRWNHLQRLRQQFWRRWNHEYLQQLQTRNKWHFRTKNIKIGMMVLLVEENIPPLHWITGRIENLHPGFDNVVRVVTVRTSKGVFKRAVKKLSILPLED